VADSPEAEAALLAGPLRVGLHAALLAAHGRDVVLVAATLPAADAKAMAAGDPFDARADTAEDEHAVVTLLVDRRQTTDRPLPRSHVALAVVPSTAHGIARRDLGRGLRTNGHLGIASRDEELLSGRGPATLVVVPSS
jgi:hypothetical protein